MPAPRRAAAKRTPATGPRSKGAQSASKEKDAAQTKREEAMDTAIVVDGVPYKLGDLTLGELGELEDHTGRPMDLISFGSAKVIAFVVYVVRRRKDPNYTLDDALTIEIRHIGSDKPGVEAEIGPDPTKAA